jgi:hypothetical protein
VAAVLQLTMPATLTRSVAIRMAKGEIPPLEVELEQRTSERMQVMALADQLGLLDGELLSRLTSRQWTRYKARALVLYAQSKVPKMMGAG